MKMNHPELMLDVLLG